MTQSNPLLDFSDLPRFDAVLPEHVSPAVDQLISEAQSVVDQASQLEDLSWQRFVVPMDEAMEKLSRAWGVVGHLHSVMNSPELRNAYNDNLPKVTAFYTALGQNQALFERYKQFAQSAAFAELSKTRQRIVEHELRDFRLSGAELPEAEKIRYAAIQEKLSALSAQFEQNLLDATDSWSRFVQEPAELSGLPEDERSAARARAEADGQPGFKFTLQFPSYYPVLQYCDNRALREELYQAYATRASEFGKADWDNGPVIEEILKLRQEEAALLGFANFGALSLATKMADTPEQVLGFLRDLAQRGKGFAQQDRGELEAFAREELGLTDLKAWDLAYVSEKLQQARYSFSQQEVKQYFTEPKVLAGLFGVINSLYGLQVKPDQGPVWHPDVRFYRIEDADGQLIGQFYLDLYARKDKRGGAWMDDARGRKRLPDGRIQTPVAYLTCNYAPPVGDKPALLTHDDVITLFHEFGHGLHHLLTQIEDRPVAGINGVEWDAVELPSQFMENFCWEWEVVEPMTAHVETGQPLPKALFDKMLAARNFQSGMTLVRQLEFGIFDMELHSRFDAHNQSVLGLLDTVRQEVAVNIPPDYNRFPMSFGHIFAGGYAAGYFSYKWAEVLSADAYAAFEESGILSRETGDRFRQEILAVGGSRPALESFKAFRGRAPQIDALLRHNGMSTH